MCLGCKSLTAQHLFDFVSHQLEYHLKTIELCFREADLPVKAPSFLHKELLGLLLICLWQQAVATQLLQSD